jgi:hypothetical protein
MNADSPADYLTDSPADYLADSPADRAVRIGVPSDGPDQALFDRLRIASQHVRHLVAQRRAFDEQPDDPYRGLYVAEAEARRLAEGDGRGATGRSAPMERLGIPRSGSRLGDVADSFSLDSLDLDLLVLAMAPDLEPRFEKLYGYLHDDITRRRLSIGLAAELVGHAYADPTVRRRFASGAQLVNNGLVIIEDRDRPELTRQARVHDRVIAHLLGDDTPSPALEQLQVPTVCVHTPLSERLAVALARGVTPIYLHDTAAGIGMGVAAAAFALRTTEALSIDLAAVDPNLGAGNSVNIALREARLTRAGLVVFIPDDIADANQLAMRALCCADWPIVIVGTTPWNTAWWEGPVVSEIVPRPETEVVTAIWTSKLPDLASEELLGATRQLRLRPDRIVSAARLAHQRAFGEDRNVTTEDVAFAARAQNSAKLERLARRIRPTVNWTDLVLPPEVMTSLHDIDTRYRRRDLVHGVWGVGGGNNRRLGVVALFAGPSGVGKTMAAEALAGELGLDLYQVNLATVVDKYIGETEKNLERIFEAAEGVNGVILFDEADALFGKRSDVSDAKDRYANVEVAYLLQRLESYEGVALLATNLRTNIDDAFTRRLDAMIDFPEPEAPHRKILWDRCLGPLVPRGDDVDFEYLSQRFRLSGGNIRNIAVSAAFVAAANDGPVTMTHLVRATADEYRKLGRLCTASEFGHWHAVL